MKFTKESLNAIVASLGLALLIGWFLGNWLLWLLLGLGLGIIVSFKTKKN